MAKNDVSWYVRSFRQRLTYPMSTQNDLGDSPHALNVTDQIHFIRKTFSSTKRRFVFEARSGLVRVLQGSVLSLYVFNIFCTDLEISQSVSEKVQLTAANTATQNVQSILGPIEQ